MRINSALAIQPDPPGWNMPINYPDSLEWDKSIDPPGW